LIKLAQKTATRNSKKFPPTQRKKQPNCAENRPTGNTDQQFSVFIFADTLQVFYIT